jgi:hypothetical protein
MGKKIAELQCAALIPSSRTLLITRLRASTAGAATRANLRESCS